MSHENENFERIAYARNEDSGDPAQLYRFAKAFVALALDEDGDQIRVLFPMRQVPNHARIQRWGEGRCSGPPDKL